MTKALSSKLRVGILVSLNEGEKSPSELAEELHEPLSNVVYHVKELLKLNSVEAADETRGKNNVLTTRYRAISQSKYSAAELAEMSDEEQNVVVEAALQNAMAEHVAAFHGGRMRGDDPTLTLSWRWFNVDGEGRTRICELLAETWDRLCDIEASSNERRTESQEEPQSVVVSLIGHPRVRAGKTFPSLIDASETSS